MDYMEQAFRLAKKANPFPNPRVGAVLVKEGKVIGKGYHKKAGMPHAEIEAIRNAKKSVKGTTLYVTLEPCSYPGRTGACTDMIISKGIGKVVYAMTDPNPLVSGAKILKEAGIAVNGPTNQRKAETINKEYIRRIKKKPFVAIKAAMSADGKTATRTGDSKWISSKKARKFVHELRSEYDAVMVGARTVKVDNPRLTARIKGGRNPIRIIVDGDLCISLNSKVLKRKDGKTIIATSEKASMKRIKEMARKSGAHVFVCGKKEVDLCSLVDVLGSIGIKKILIEGGSELNAKALEAGVVNKFYISVSPKIIGGRNAIGVIGGDGIEFIKNAVILKT